MGKRGRPPLSDRDKEKRGIMREITHILNAIVATLGAMSRNDRNQIDAILRNNRSKGGRPVKDHARDQWLLEVVIDAQRRDIPKRDALKEAFERKYRHAPSDDELLQYEYRMYWLLKRMRPKKSRPTAREENRTNSSDQETGTVDAGITSSAATTPELASSAPPAPAPKAASPRRSHN
jgi:hypothetical protein